MKTSPSSRARLWTCYGGMMCVAVAVNLPPVYLTTFSETFGGDAGLTAEQLGRIPAFLFAALTLGILISGPLADRWGAKRFAVLGPALVVGGLALMGLARSYGMLLAAALVAGTGVGILDMILSPIVSVLEPHRRAAAMNLLHAFFCIGAVLTVVIASTALARDVPWRAVFLVATLLPVAVTIGFAVMPIPKLTGHTGDRERARHLLRRGLFLALLAVIFLGGAAEAGIAQWLPAFAETELDMTKSAAGHTLAAFLFVMALGRLATAAVAHRVGPVRLLLGGCIAAAGCYAVACFVPVVPVALAGAVGIGLAVSCFWPTVLALSGDHFVGGGATMFALLAAVGNAGCFTMPWLVGIIAQVSAIRIGLAVAGACPVLMGVLLWRMRKKLSDPVVSMSGRVGFVSDSVPS